MSENNPKSTGVAREIAESFHCLSCFYPDMRPGLFEGDLHSPTLQEPAQHLLRLMVEAHREQSLRLKLSRRVADQKQAERDRPTPAATPDRRLGVDLNFALLPAVPMLELDLRPLRWGDCRALVAGKDGAATLTRGRPVCPALRAGAGT
jgi:hypothetical protein